MRKGPSAFNIASIALGLAFLYAPILVLALYSFNASRLVTVWGGFSTRWYAALFRDAQLLDAIWVTLRVGALSATMATLVALPAAIALTRGRRARTALAGGVYATLVMPEVILGLSLLLLFVSLGLPRGFWTVTLSHATLTLAYATVIIQARLATFDRSLEEAAQDLGCPPWKAFVLVTLPGIAPAVAAAWMLAFTLSLDDLVIASFTSGPGSTTLPMRLYSQVRLGVDPKINAVSTLLIGFVATGVIAAYLFQQRRRRSA
ncbi:ABC transporter permease [Phenylobacterium kunshanense]|uniref:Putrescine ABC transporter permease PotI n=1 Tax=Phenylobacterium kunshanense TaxID=1445034 RepID=A0A328B5X1_9CAUL|nr:ABC transporter permease [Phenylobacterium kunshanense]RAK62279.1 putrescine ABC transporter permease PotI [Phenylobacterium kunshanense]